MAASGNMNGTNFEIHYSSIISICSMRTVVFLDELNNTKTHTGDIINAYLNERTTEKILFNAGSDFVPFGHDCHLLLIRNALYGLNIYGYRFHY